MGRDPSAWGREGGEGTIAGLDEIGRDSAKRNHAQWGRKRGPGISGEQSARFHALKLVALTWIVIGQ